MPQEIKYSKLEGEMASYVLGGTIPAEDEQKVSTTRQSFNQSTAEGTVSSRPRQARLSTFMGADGSRS